MQVIRFTRHLLLYSIVTLVILLLILIWRGLSSRTQHIPPSAPPDVRAVISEFRHTEELQYGAFSVQGKRAVQRGKSLLGLRVTAAKTTLFDNIKGSIRSPEGELFIFSASSALWDMDINRPLVLDKDIYIVIRGTALRQVKRAWLHLREGTVVVQNEKTTEYSLR